MMHLIFTERSFKENKYFSPTSHIQFVKCEIPLKNVGKQRFLDGNNQH